MGRKSRSPSPRPGPPTATTSRVATSSVPRSPDREASTAAEIRAPRSTSHRRRAATCSAPCAATAPPRTPRRPRKGFQTNIAVCGHPHKQPQLLFVLSMRYNIVEEAWHRTAYAEEVATGRGSTTIPWTWIPATSGALLAATTKQAIGLGCARERVGVRSTEFRLG